MRPGWYEFGVLGEIARIVASARARLGHAWEDVAREAEIPESALRALASGRPGITTTQLTRVAKILGLNPAALLRGHEQVDEQPSVFLRHAGAQDFDFSDLPILDLAIEQGRALISLNDALGEVASARRSGRLTPRDAGGDRPDRAAREGHELATEVRRLLGIPAGPIDDVRRTLEELFEIAVVVEPLHSTRVTAVGVRQLEAAVVLLNEADPERARNPVLARVHLAHELCHVLFDPSSGGVHVVVDTVADRRALRSEQRARGFAAELLLPRQGLVALLGEPRGVTETDAATEMVATARMHFHTPHEIAAHHVCNHGFVDEPLRDWLVAGGPSGPRTFAQITLPPSGSMSLLVLERTQRAHDLGLITDGEARSALRLDVLAPLPWE